MSDGSPVLAVGAIILRTPDQILLIKRGREPSAGRWSLPGGRVEFGETLEEAVQREVFEETGIVTEVGQLLGWVERRYQSHHFVIMDFLAEVARSDTEVVPRAGDDAVVARWVMIAELETLELVEGLYSFLVDHGIA
ncbi:MAG: NUDIX hydrolase [Acidimicrobiales bacterium]